ncbi:MAG: DUF1080 domain-containing protein [Bacteroidota bacterium]
MTPEMTEIWEPEVKIVTPGSAEIDVVTPAPSDAIVLFDGRDLAQWEAASNRNAMVKGKDTAMYRASTSGNAEWVVSNGELAVNKDAGDIQTKQSFGDFQLHIEWRIPEGIHGEGQYRGNSGIFIQNYYEVQILDSYNNKTYSNGQAGSIYKQTAPLVNPVRKPGEWNRYDIIYTAPTYKSDSTYRTKPIVTVLLNGVLVQHSSIIHGTTPYIGWPQTIFHGKGPIRLQAHGDESEPISFRNIWIREL